MWRFKSHANSRARISIKIWKTRSGPKWRQSATQSFSEVFRQSCTGYIYVRLIFINKCSFTCRIWFLYIIRKKFFDLKNWVLIKFIINKIFISRKIDVNNEKHSKMCNQSSSKEWSNFSLFESLSRDLKKQNIKITKITRIRLYSS